MSLYQFAQFHFDTHKGCLYLGDHSESVEEISLRHKIANLLTYLIENRERVISKDELLNELWDHGEYRENALIQSIRELRKALGDSAQNPSFIRTFPQRGYQWIAPVEQVSERTAAADIHLPADPSMEVPSAKMEKSVDQSVSKPRHINIYLAVALSIVMIVVAAFTYTNTQSTDTRSPISDTVNTESITAIQTVESLLVLPFINATEQDDMAWLELGLADMLAIELKRSLKLNITPPALSHGLLLDAELQWPALPVHIRSLLNAHNLQAALFASVRLHNGQQVMDFQLIYANGKTQQGSISYPSLPAAVAPIGKQLSHLLIPGSNTSSASSAPRKTSNPIAAQALAEGIQTQQKQGALAAKKYFEATQVLTPENPWANAYLARSEVLLGNWRVADELLASIPDATLIQDRSLDAFINYWRSELAFRQGKTNLEPMIATAINKAETAADAIQMARSYRLRAAYAWQQMDWNTHSQWLIKADRLLGGNHELQTQAENLFYLGNPSNEGLEKSPLVDLNENQKRLQKALNFYQQLGHQPMIAASQLAIAQNYSFPLTTREQALYKALKLYRELNQPYELAQSLIYAGFYQMQLHNGQLASEYFHEAKQISENLGATTLDRFSRFYLAFASLDQGLNQSALGRHGRNDQLLRQSITQLQDFIATQPDPLLHTSALIFLGWAYTDLEEYVAAERYLKHALDMHDSVRIPTTFGYASYSLMRIYLAQQNYDAVIAMADQPITTRLQAGFLARAYYENRQPIEAAAVLRTFKQQHPQLWQQIDDLRLAQYLNAKEGTVLSLSPEPAAHLVYCESDWTL